MEYPQSGSLSRSRHAVLLKNVTKAYEHNKPILNQISMTVDTGIVYGLLGSSGCGKTTLLSCLLGIHKWSAGEVVLMGQLLKNGTLSWNQRQDIGYMPQELALHEKLSPIEMGKLYGHLYGMNKNELENKWTLLEHLLKLNPFAHKRISNLSGGQKRRVSLSLALLHSPRLLILDEPTVGLDPLLRKSIWDYLYNLTTVCDVTVLITTHYIEELRHANKIGIMRKGRMIAEDNPEFLIESMGTTTLESTVLKICKQDEIFATVDNPKALPYSCIEYGNNLFQWQKWKGFEEDHSHLVGVSGKYIPRTDSFGSLGNLSGLRGGTSWVNLLGDSMSRTMYFTYVLILGLIRNMLIVPIILVPLVQLFTSAVVGIPPIGINFGVVNNEKVNWTTECSSSLVSDGSECSNISLSCIMIEQLFAGQTLTPVQFLTADDAEVAVRTGSVWGYIEIPESFTEHIWERGVHKQFTTSEALDGIITLIQMDMSHTVITFSVFNTIQTGFFNFISMAEKVCDTDLSTLQIAIKQGNVPVYGKMDTPASTYIVPAVIVMIALEVALALTPLVYLNEYHQGTLHRARVAGLNPVEEQTAVVLTIMSYSIFQSLVCYVCLVYGLKYDLQGSLAMFLILSLLATLCGVMIGLYIGLIVMDQATCIIITVILVPIVLINTGALSPMEAASHWFREASSVIPFLSIMAPLRSALNRGVSITHPTVWPGVLVSIAWFFFVFLLCMIHRKIFNR